MRVRDRVRSSGFFVIRSPLLPWDELEAWSGGLQAPTALPSNLPDALAQDRAILRARLSAALLRPEVREALFLASPSLEGDLEFWLREPESERGHRLELALSRYYQRMCGRSTPFGTCAGFSTGTTGSSTRLHLQSRREYRRHSRPDTRFLSGALAVLQAQLAPHLRYRPNSSLYEAGGRLRYVESRVQEDKTSWFSSAIEKTDELLSTLGRAEAGKNARELAEALVHDDITPEDASAYIDELIAAQVIVPDLACRITGAEPLSELLANMNSCKDTPAGTALELLQSELISMDREGLGHPPQRYRTLAEQIEVIPSKRDLSKTFQVDLVKPASEAILGEEVIAEIARGVQWLRRLLRPPSASALTRFRDAFLERYEEREVPLLEALDEECGIGFRRETNLTRDRWVEWGSREDWLLRKLSEAISSGAQEVVLKPAEIEALGIDQQPPLSDAFWVMATIAADSEEALNQGRYQILLHGAGGPSGASLLGRFCHADDFLCEAVRRHLRDEEAAKPDAVFAEIVHLPEPRIGNVLERPVLRKYEIIYLGHSGAPIEHQIPISDLWLSVRAGKLFLRSARLGRQVLPRLTTAHNYSASCLPVYRFLCELAQDGGFHGAWHWGPFQSAPFLPRIRCGRVVFSRAQWNLEREELRELNAPTAEGRFRAVVKLQASRKLPRRAVLSDGDNTLPLDFDNCLSVDNFIHLVHRRESATVTELFPAPDQCILLGPEGRFAHELIVPFIREPDSAEDPVQIKTSSQPRISEMNQEVFPPGSEWLYAKAYCGPVAADTLLRDFIPPFIAGVKKASLIDRWFFIRYGDPDGHLRLRFHGQPAALLRKVLPGLKRLLDPHLASGAVVRWDVDTYRRETDRYGSLEGVLLAEELFQIDSETVLDILQTNDADAVTDRWHFGICSTDRLLDDLGFGIESKLEIIKEARAGQGVQGGPAEARRPDLGRALRRDRARIESIFRMTPAGNEKEAAAFEALRRRSAGLLHLIRRLKAAEKEGALKVPVQTLSRSYIHMHLNRLLRSRQRAQELQVYDALVCLYESLLARRGISS